MHYPIIRSGGLVNDTESRLRIWRFSLSYESTDPKTTKNANLQGEEFTGELFR